MILEEGQIKCYTQVYLYFLIEADAYEIRRYIESIVNDTIENDIESILIGSLNFVCKKRNGMQTFVLNI